MKKVYLLLLMVCTVGSLVAQNTTQSDLTNSETQNHQVQSSSSVPSTLADWHGSVSTAKSIEDLPGYPVLQNTGNAEQDKMNYEAAKEKWINANREIYDAFIEKNNKKENVTTDKPKN